MLDTETICSVGSNSDDSGPPSLQNEFDNLQTVEKSAETDTLHQQNQATSPQSDSSPIVPNAPSNGLFNYLFIFIKTQLYKFYKNFHYLFKSELLQMKILNIFTNYRYLMVNILNDIFSFYIFKHISEQN